MVSSRNGSYNSYRSPGDYHNEPHWQAEQAEHHDGAHDPHDTPKRFVSIDEDDSSYFPRSTQVRSKTFNQRDTSITFNDHETFDVSYEPEANGVTASVNGDGSSQSKAQREDINTSTSDSIRGPQHQPNVIPEVAEKSWSDFMNKKENDDKEYAIEILKGKPDYYDPAKPQDRPDRVLLKDVKTVAGSGRITPGDAFTNKTPQSPDRIRINSPHILNVLASMEKHIDASAPVVLRGPYKLLVHHDERIRTFVARIEFQLQDGNMSESETELTETTLKHLRCLTGFMDKYIEPILRRLSDASATMIRFQDLWYLFPPGETIHMPLKRLRAAAELRSAMGTTPDTFAGRYEMTWRVTGVGGGRRNICDSNRKDVEIRKNDFEVNCYYIDYDGKFFQPIVHRFSIVPYSGEREINTLPFYPVRFMSDDQDQRTWAEITSRGRDTFRTIGTGFKHFYYRGHTMVTQPCGCFLEGEDLHQEYLESEVIVDFKQTLLRHPRWRPKPNFWKALPRFEGEVFERQLVRYWSDSKRKKLASTDRDYVHNDYHIDKERGIIFRDEEQIFSPIPSGWTSNAEMVPDKDTGLLAGRVFAFVLRTRSFAPLWLWNLVPIQSQNESLCHLQLRDNTLKDVVQNLVNSHFRRAEQQVTWEHDIIEGKGKGLIVLLHGAPGTGKTSTAESVAAACGRPLLQITCGDLGLTPVDVERALKEIFRYAQTWNCVLLLDECEIFLTRRFTNQDIIRNALVSIFLRTLEFFTGVLFLTTNRVGILDEAVKSRLTYTAYYPPLDKKQTMDIWKVNLQLLQARNQALEVDETAILRFAKKQYKHNATNHSVWSGRQIQNAFKVATALAEWDNRNLETPQSASDRRPRLLPHHFEVIAHGTEAFDSYLREAVGYTDAERAYNDMVRADEHEYESVGPRASYDFNNMPPASPVQAYRRSSNNLVPYRSNETEPNNGRSAQYGMGDRRLSTNWQRQPSPSTQPTAAHPHRRRQSSTVASNNFPTDIPTTSSRLENPVAQQLYQNQTPPQGQFQTAFEAQHELEDPDSDSDVSPEDQLSNSRFLSAPRIRGSTYGGIDRT